ncbi:MAG: hypothetical protein JWQ09_680, partial [Segetibacter sp.]|nr:hypothetical protein [Segetibacter sp.]
MLKKGSKLVTKKDLLITFDTNTWFESFFCFLLRLTIVIFIKIFNVNPRSYDRNSKKEFVRNSA